ncbi:MAG: GerAB/ArcD/ProY family transporter [Clostridia bacterium]|nr:GerAB/ArcD/ProY family transporter [Clostridia bacterium]
MTNSKLGTIEGIAFIVIIILNHIVLNLPKSLIDQCGSSTCLNLIYITILVFIFLTIMLKLWKPFGNSDILDISEFLGGKVLKVILGFLFILYFITISGTLLRNFSEMLKLVYFERTTICIILLFFLVTCVIANTFGFKAITKCNLIIVPIMLLNLLIAFFCIFSRFEIKRIFPIFGYGINQTFFSGMSNLFAFTGISYLYFLKPLLKKPEDFNKISYISIGISAFYLFLSITTLLFSFADILTINELSPVYLLIRGTDFGRFLQRPDALFILGWILSLMSYLSITIWSISNIFKKITKTKDTKPMIYSFAALIFVCALIPKNMAEIRFIQNIIFRYFTIILVFIISFLILLLANIKHKKNHSKPEKEVLIKDE